ncbi:hypothetical protein [Sphingobacterium alkalisoli]|nr:hypothetical protein [Sphingobacterium alkalisoli]
MTVVLLSLEIFSASDFYWYIRTEKISNIFPLRINNILPADFSIVKLAP